MVGLSEGSQASLGGGDGVVLVGGFAFEGDEDECPSAGFEDASQFAQGFAIVGDMLEDVAAENDIEGIVRELDVGDVDFKVGGVEEIRAGIAGSEEFTQAGFEGLLGGEVQHRLGEPVEEISLALEEEPDEAVTFAGVAPDAQDVPSGLAWDGGEGAGGTSTDGAAFLEAEEGEEVFEVRGHSLADG